MSYKLPLILFICGIAANYLLTIRLIPDPYTFPSTVNVTFGSSNVSDVSIRPFSIEITGETIKDLKKRINNWKRPPSSLTLDHSYGVNVDKLEKLVNYWKNGYQWNAAEKWLNQFPQFKTVIQGLDIHFVHLKGEGNVKNKIPILLINGWSSSFVEFFKVFPLLTQRNGDIAFDIVCPSIPGFGFSEAPLKSGFTAISAADIFAELMKRLGYERFVVHGGDWGAVIGGVLSHKYADLVVGFHTTMPMPSSENLKNIIYNWGTMIFPRFFVSHDKDFGKFTIDSHLWWLEEGGYFHEQATKPDTIGIALSDSPIGLAAYLLDIYVKIVDRLEIETGDSETSVSNDEFLTNVIIYWITNTATSSMRIYK